MARNYHQGYYEVQNKEKYMLNDKNPYYRSSWEQRVFHYMDHNENIIRWAAEHLKMPYFFPIDGKQHSYTPDIYCEVIARDGSKKYWLIEVKPQDQSKPPKPPKKRTTKAMKRYHSAQVEVHKNKCKWDAADLYCKKRGWVFKVITEKDIFNGQY